MSNLVLGGTMMKSSTAVARIFALGVLIAIIGPAVAQQAYPSKPIRIIVVLPPGGGTDLLARLLGSKLTERWGQPVIVDNRVGGNTVIGTEAAAKSTPDGYTIMITSGSHVIIPNLVPVPFDAIRDFAPVATLARTELLLLLHPSVAASNLQDLIALAKSKPGQLNYASSGNGALPHLGMEMFNIMAAVKIQHVPYKGAAQALIGLLGGQVQMFLGVPQPAIPHINNGKLKSFAITGETRLSALPEVPTFTEAGLPGFDMGTWYGFLAPLGTPKGIIDKLSAEITKLLGMPDFREELSRRGVTPLISTPDQFTALMKADLAKYAKLIKAANIKLE